MEKSNAVAETLADPQYKAGRKLIEDGRLEEAVEFFGGLLETRVALLDDEMSPALAPLYYEYGNALLYNAEESGAVFGDAITDAEKKRAMAMLEAQVEQQALLEQGVDAAVVCSGDKAAGTAPVGAGQGEDSAAGGGLGSQSGGAGDTSPVAGDQEAEEDLEIAWENLEMARRIFVELEVTDEIRTVLGKVYLRLGDLNMVNGMYNEAADEFQKCREYRTALPNPMSRGVADAHVRRAQALFYASTLDGAEKDSLVAASLEQYRAAAGIFEKMLTNLKAAESSSQGPESARKESNGQQRQVSPTTATTATASVATSGESNGMGKGKGKYQEATRRPASSSNANGDGKIENGAEAADAGAQIFPGSAEDIQDVLDTIRETIETLVSGKDMDALAEYRKGAVSTTVGFGVPSSAGESGAGSIGASAVVEVTTIGFQGAVESAVNGGDIQTEFDYGHSGPGRAAGAGTAGPSMMVVKRKGRPTPKAVPGEGGTVEAGASGGGSRTGEAAKKPKSGA